MKETIAAFAPKDTDYFDQICVVAPFMRFENVMLVAVVFSMNVVPDLSVYSSSMLDSPSFDQNLTSAVSRRKSKRDTDYEIAFMLVYVTPASVDLRHLNPLLEEISNR